MGHEELKEIGINAYGHRHKLIKGVERLLAASKVPSVFYFTVRVFGNHKVSPESNIFTLDLYSKALKM